MNNNRNDLTDIQNPQRFMTFVYTGSLAIIAILSIITHFVLDSVIEQQSQTGNLVNKSGQQRMLSQRASMFAIEYESSGSKGAKELAESAILQMKSNHAALLSEHDEALKKGLDSPLSDELLSLYFESPAQIDKQIDTFSRLISQSLEQVPTTPENTSEQVHQEFLMMARAPFLDALNAAVEQYERESIEKIGRLRLVQQVILVVVILTILLEALFVFRPMVARISQFAARLQYEANYDHLSGLYNRRAFFRIAEKLLQSLRRKEKPCSIVLFDIDRFKAINDNYGHDVGDIVIQNLAQLLKAQLRKHDILSRLGGEEFILFLPETSHQEAMLVANKIRIYIEDNAIYRDTQDLKVTVSGGVANCDFNESLDKSIKKADEGLYKAKSNGRNQICYIS
ncbi:diguanylate cyclase [Brumicola nitratireducens]|uniref:diguanylate cyclase n=1 Tax=Glaciecola nitratireducens (strain JCM 12485 / KCTC 12276 / FR1064) TaxID=1085623 RepID=G4QMV3_GLANF|nr:diguanylate cyclase [Glaciecola nitratireducens]AEP31036.1 diguanylate cyclase [Glaciecola nitratireducens FR1064]